MPKRVFSVMTMHKKIFPGVQILISYTCKKSVRLCLSKFKVYKFKSLRIHQIFGDTGEQVKIIKIPIIGDFLYFKDSKKILSINTMIPTLIAHIQEFENLDDAILFQKLMN